MLLGHQASLFPAGDGAVPARPPRIPRVPVHALAIEPLSMPLTVTGRKAYDVMMHIARRSAPDAEGWYASPVDAILRGGDSTTEASERLQQYLAQMVRTAVVWRPSAATAPMMPFSAEDASPPETDAGAGSGRAAEPRSETVDEDGEDEARPFPLLSEAWLSRRDGEAWVKWAYPPSIREYLVDPAGFAQIELPSMALLTTYTSVALYQICARCKSDAEALTRRAAADAWGRVLREGGNIRPREWRKIKNELVVPAIAEINEATEIVIELVEHRQGSAVVSVQFKVTRKPDGRDPARGPADMTQVLRAAGLAIRETDFDAATTRYGASKVAEALDALESFMNDPTASKIVDTAAHLRTILANRYPDNRAEILAPQETEAPGPKQHAIDGENRGDLVTRWVAARFKQLAAEFASLADDERAKWIEAAATGVTTPAVRKRLRNRDWMSPLVNQLVLDGYAIAVHGADWKRPTDMDLTMFKVAETRRSR